MRRATTTFAVVGLVALALLAAGCGSSSPSGSGSPGTTSSTTAGSPLVGPWTLTGFTADGKETAAPATPAALTLVDDGTFSGTTGCNQLSGTWSGDVDGAFTITPGPMTQRACVDPFVQAQESALVTNLPKVTDATVDGTTLTMTGAGGVPLLRWTRGAEGIVGSYTVTGVNNGNDAVVSSAATEKASITFDADGTVSGNTGCNSFSGSYTLDGTSLVIDGDVAATMMACEDASQQLEQQFLDALAQVATWERSGGTVTLRDGSGATQMTLQASS